jgi:hypothetical protein
MDGSRQAAELGKCPALRSFDSCRTVALPCWPGSSNIDSWRQCRRSAGPVIRSAPGSWSVGVAAWCRCAARLCAVGLSLWRGHGAGSRLARATLLSECASCALRRTWARGSRAAEALRGGGRRDAPRPARPGVLVPVDDRQRMAAPVTGYGVPAAMGEGGRPDRGRPSRSDPGNHQAAILLTTCSEHESVRVEPLAVQIDAPMSVKGSDDVLNLSISVFRKCCSGWGC